ncbi:hypothetical protein O7602_09315 [Micromonospora sp. WMMD1128]|nr:hypothetical protein [Micromonospora sp. WMMD1128]WBB75680.1 hypothetical protein O7602_09315 [Micromonospora sp. WMMD1128]
MKYLAAAGYRDCASTVGGNLSADHCGDLFLAETITAGIILRR